MQLTATLPRRGSFTGLAPHGFHRVNYWEWGNPGNPRVVICVHGLARNGRDFDVLAETLAASHRVLAIDLPGRGDSEWLRDASDYVLPTYIGTLVAFIARSGAERVDWIGTSMGGLLGMMLAAQPGSPIARLVINDVGPVIEPAALARINTYLGANPVFATFDDLVAQVRAVSAPFGPLSDAQWTFVAGTNARRNADGRWRLAYDPGIALPLRSTPLPADVWPVWDAITCPTLLLRGEQSDLLAAATARAMQERGPRARVIEFAGVGHAPMLFEPDQVEPIVAFLAPASDEATV